MKTIIRELHHKAGYGIWIIDDQNKEHSIAKPVELVFEKHQDSWMMPEPTLEIGYQYAQPFLQSLINTLVDAGIKPDNDKIAGQYEATKEHLRDLQKLVDRLLNQLDKK
jgi:hypothetical protein